MNVTDSARYPPEFLDLTENWLLSGRWSWTFASGQIVWSPGLFHLLGLESGDAEPSYELFRRFVHPEDRNRLASAIEVMQGKPVAETNLRVIRADGTMRILSIHHTHFHEPDGRPRAVIGVALDVTDRDRLARARAVEQRRHAALIEKAHTLIYSCRPGTAPDRYPLFAKLIEPAWEEVEADPLVVVVPEERGRARDVALHGRGEGILHQGLATLRMAGGARASFRTVVVPIRDEHGVIVEWSGITYPSERPAPSPCTAMREGLEQQLTGHHLRAARGLLDWSMADLARASGLSLSTVRRLEEGGEAVTARSRQGAIATLQRHAVRFIVMDDGNVAVALS